MKRESTKLILGIAIITLAISFFAYLGHRRENRPFAKQSFSNDIKIVNRLNNPRLDTIALVLAEKVYGYDSITIVIQQLHLKSDGFKFYGVTQKISDNIYMILLNPNMGCSKNKLALSHEFVHINQFKRGDLTTFNGKYVWKGEFISLNYKDRPHEKEAFAKQFTILKHLNKFLY